ncbi:galactokinase [Nocardia cyriacigeorgica]|uniref:galactokinase n=1 Tax=Nocardia cyriacigeorgica TaxID=135487 RepID=UPI001893D795|nr:galactokinase [Nocardia cyriacigeorgica]MBF6086811.1 galactokinase [Nocardia cyriacigeorgica]MBF6090864.1 galactokinase [Nocardia cyriacigeorgica]MBF6395524.1 galactokinase [Nocardia cyriacigeorgica]MBF6401156.1 galactokinase [Nocardia cyriacigeorgica]
MPDDCDDGFATWVAPGRVNIIGEHTDYNDGYVLPIALPMTVECAARRRGDDRVLLRSRQRPGERIALGLGALERERVALPGWARYPLGVVSEFVRRGHRVDGVELRIDGRVPIGAGLSSSAALCCSVAIALRDLFGIPVSERDLIELTRAAENRYAGVPTGILDQSASILCTPGHALFLDVQRFGQGGPEAYAQIPFDLRASGLELLVVDTGHPHRLAESGYSERRTQCMAAAAELGVRSLREIGSFDALARLGDPVLLRRARHVVGENARVLEVVALLRAGADPRQIGPVLTASHSSLREDFEVSTPGLDTAVTAALAAGAYGARMVGGGFGGSVIALVDQQAVGAVTAAVRDGLVGKGLPAPSVFTVVPAAGAHRVW